MSKRYPGGIIRKTPQTPSQTSAQGIWDMASVTQAVKENTWPIAGVPDPISKSLRFRQSASASLTRTVAGVNTTQLTFSFWVKYGVNANDNVIYATSNNSSNYLYIGFNPSFALDVQIGATANRRITTQVFRDPSAWYHIVVTFDTTQATASDRIKIYVNGSQVTAFSTNTTGVSQNANLPSISSTLTNYIGNYNGSAGFYFDGYMTELYAVYGQALTPSSFGSTNDQTGVWQPIAYTGTYGTNGFYLPFSNTASTTTLGYDFSGNSNNWTTNNISLTSGTTYDSMVDVPTQWIPYNTAGDTGALFRGNYCTWNPLAGDTSKITVSDGNLNAQGSSTSCSIGGTMQLLSGKWYWEVTITKSNVQQVGIIGDTLLKMNASVTAGDSPGGYIYLSNGAFYNNNTTSLSGSSYTTNDVISVAYDADSRKLWFAKNGTWQNSGVPASGTGQVFTTSSSYTYIPVASAGLGTDQVGQKINFGQQPFSYTPPSGFKTLCTTNLSTPTIGATASNQAGKYFNAVTYTGTGAGQTITGVGFQPDFVWMKCRDTGSTNNILQNSVVGATKGLESNTTASEFTDSSTITAFTSDGFTAGGNLQTNQSSKTYVAWNWKANGSGSTNTAGSITSTVSANTTAGFSIVTFTSPSSGTATVGHGLGVAPSLIITKSRSSVGGWPVYHASIGNTNYLDLQTTAASVSTTFWNNTSPTSSVFTIGSPFAGSLNLLAYCFAQVAGYSAFGSYVGNGNADGPFIYTGFRPRYYILKNITNAQSWSVQDTARSPYNVGSAVLFPNSSSAESTGTDFVDILSNGFKIRHSSSGNNNNNGDTYIYMAFAESPFKYALAR